MREHPLKHMFVYKNKAKLSASIQLALQMKLVLRACMQRAKETNSVLLIEATANQVDQYGGYTGMKPKDFMKFVEELAAIGGLDMDRIILGGDHLGPLTFVQYEKKRLCKKPLNSFVSLYLLALQRFMIDTSMKVAK